MSTWATLADVLAKTGRTVAQTDLDQAEGHVEMLTGLIAAFASTLANKRDLYWLKAAVCYQAAWVADQPDLYGRIDVSSTGQDGQNASLKADALVLGPLARRALKRLSWRGTRTLSPLAMDEHRRTRGQTQGDDDTLPWRAL